MRIDGYVPVDRNSDSSGAPPSKQVRAKPESVAQQVAFNASTDSVQLSPLAVQASRSQEVAKLAQELSETRPEMIQHAKNFIAAGRHNDQNVIEKTAENLGQFLGL
jgi:hypothetical protein